MKHTISPDRKTLTITVDEQERATLMAWNDDQMGIESDAAMVEFLEPLTSNSDLVWINPADTGDLTDAPMLGILGKESTRSQLPEQRFGAVCCGCWGEPPVPRFNPILERWAFMDYQVRSVLEDLRDKGECVFIS